jgi:hypothetical protein
MQVVSVPQSRLPSRHKAVSVCCSQLKAKPPTHAMALHRFETECYDRFILRNARQQRDCLAWLRDWNLQESYG